MNNEKTPEDRNRFEVGPAAVRSAIANGSRLLEGLDGRSAPARRYRDLIHNLSSDLGGQDSLTEAELQLVRTAAGLVVVREAMDARVLNGEPIDVGEYCRLVNTTRRMLESVGIKARVMEAVPSLDAYARELAQEVSP